MAFTDTVKRVMELGGAIREYWERELPRRHPRYPFVDPGADDGPPPPEQAELERVLGALPEEQLYALAALMRLGQGFFGADEVTGQYEETHREFSGPEQAARFLASMVMLDEHLGAALEKLASAGLDADRLPRAPVAAAG